MSNKIVPGIYRSVIDDVIANIRNEFDEYGVAEDVLAELQHKWEDKVIASHVAEFEVAQQSAPAPAPPQAPHHHAYPPHPIHMMPTHPHYAQAHNPYAPMTANNGQTTVKTEPMESRYILAPNMQYTLPPLPGPQINGARQLPPLPHPGGQTGVLSFPRPQQPAPNSRPSYSPPIQQQPQQPQRMPQVDGPSESSGDEDTPSPPASQTFAPRASHPSLPQPPSQTPSMSSREDSEAINSDLDDSDTEGEEDAEEGTTGETDIVFCTYDKVARVKNKWKCILKDGMIHVNGKDYLFAKCTGEFEW